MDALVVATDAVTTAADDRVGGRADLTGRGASTRLVLISPMCTPPPSGSAEAETVAAFCASAATLGAGLEVVVAHPPAAPGDGPGAPPATHPALVALAPLLAALPTRVKLRVGVGPEGVAGALADPGVGSTVYWSGDLDLLLPPPPAGDGAAAAGARGAAGPAPSSRGPSPALPENFPALAVKLSKRTAPARPPAWKAVVEGAPPAAAAGGAGGQPHQTWVDVGTERTYNPAGTREAAAAAAAAAGDDEAAPDAPDAPVPLAVDEVARIPAWRYGGEWVPVPDAVKDRLGFGAPRGLGLVGFAVPAPPITGVSPSGGGWLMAPAPDAGPGNRDALAALARATARAGGAAILRWVDRARGEAGGRPRLYAAYPALPGEFDVVGDVAALEAEIAAALGGGGGGGGGGGAAAAAAAAQAPLPAPHHPACFVLVELPFSEDVRPLRFPGFPLPGGGGGGGGVGAGAAGDAPTDAQLGAAVSLVDAWESSRRAAPEALANPVRSRALAWAGARAVAVADGAPDFPQPIPPPPRLSELAERTEGGAGLVVPAHTDAAARCVYAGPAVPGSAAHAAAAAFAAAFQGTVRLSPEPGEKERAEARKKKEREGGRPGAGGGGGLRGRPSVSPERSE